jgi:hypothetical protein
MRKGSITEVYPNRSEWMSLPFDPGRRILDVRKAQKSLMGDDRPPPLLKAEIQEPFLVCVTEPRMERERGDANASPCGAQCMTVRCSSIRKRDRSSSVREIRHMLEVSQESTVLRQCVQQGRRPRGSLRGK